MRLDRDTLAAYHLPPPVDGRAPVQPVEATLRTQAKRALPKKATLDYTIAAITAFVLVLSLPWLLRNTVKRPGAVIAAAGRKQVGK